MDVGDGVGVAVCVGVGESVGAGGDAEEEDDDEDAADCDGIDSADVIGCDWLVVAGGAAPPCVGLLVGLRDCEPRVLLSGKPVLPTAGVLAAGFSVCV